MNHEIDENFTSEYWDDEDTELDEGFALHAGTVLKGVLEDRGIKISALANHIGVARPGFNNMLNGNRALTAAMATKIEDAIGFSAELLMAMQARHDLAIAKADDDNHVEAMVLAMPA